MKAVVVIEVVCCRLPVDWDFFLGVGGSRNKSGDGRINESSILLLKNK
jgi:hypothetical protein